MKPRFFKRMTIATRLLWAFLVMALVPLSVVTYLIYTISEQSLQAEVSNNLRAIADSKANQIETYARERQRNVTALARMPSIVNAFEPLDQAFHDYGIGTPEYAAVEHELRPFLSDYLAQSGYADIVLLSPSGDAIFSVRQGEDLGSNFYTGPNKDTELARVFDRAKTLLVTEVSNFEYYAATNEPAAFIAAPVFKDGGVIGVVVLQMSNQEVYKVVNDATGLGQTGETVVGSRVDNDVIFVTPVRHDPYAAFRRRLPLGSALGLVLQQAAQGQQGQGLDLDYRGQQVMAAWRYLPALRWAMVVKIDAAEAFAPIVKQRHTVLIVGSITLLCVVLGALLVARSLSKPILSQTRVVRLLSGGDLQQTVPVVRHDEIGELSQAFNKMAADLQESYATLEQRVEERTTQLAQAHTEISLLNQRLTTDNLRMRAELDFVGQMQQMVLPTPDELAAIDSLDIAAFMAPADEVGGDYYDVLHTDGVVTIGIGDVTGHGLESGMLMVMTQAAVRTLQTTRESDPVRFLDTLNRTLYHNVQRMRSDKNLTLALLTYVQGQVCISGQHEEALIVRRDGVIERIDTLDLGFPLGLEADIAAFVRHTSVVLQPGDGIVLYTDGITEAADMHHRLYGIDRLCTVISQHSVGTAQDIQAAVIADVRCHIGAQKVFDDITLVVAKQR